MYPMCHGSTVSTSCLCLFCPSFPSLLLLPYFLLLPALTFQLLLSTLSPKYQLVPYLLIHHIYYTPSYLKKKLRNKRVIERQQERQREGETARQRDCQKVIRQTRKDTEIHHIQSLDTVLPCYISYRTNPKHRETNNNSTPLCLFHIFQQTD